MLLQSACAAWIPHAAPPVCRPTVRLARVLCTEGRDRADDEADLARQAGAEAVTREEAVPDADGGSTLAWAAAGSFRNVFPPGARPRLSPKVAIVTCDEREKWGAFGNETTHFTFQDLSGKYYRYRNSARRLLHLRPRGAGRTASRQDAFRAREGCGWRAPAKLDENSAASWAPPPPARTHSQR